jgi:hypothetical protein
VFRVQCNRVWGWGWGELGIEKKRSGNRKSPDGADGVAHPLTVLATKFS